MGPLAADPARSSLGGLAWACAFAALASRLPFVARRLWDHDSVQFALGVENFDLAAHHPHPPGYPLYIALLKLMATVGIEPLWGMVSLSLAASGLGAFFMVLLGGHLAVERKSPDGGPPGEAAALSTGAFCGALYVFNPLLWFYGELPLVYAVEGGLVVVLAYGVLRMERTHRTFLPTCALYALMGGVRPSTVVLLAPLFLYGVLRWWRSGTVTARQLGLGVGVGLVAGLAWGLPLLAASGGWWAYRRIAGDHFGALLPQTSVLYGAGAAAAVHNLEVLVKWTLQGVFPGGVVLLCLWAAGPKHVGRGLSLLASRSVLLLFWVVPPLAFFTLFHVTKAGYILVFLPALLVAVGLAAAPSLNLRRGTAAVLLAVLLGASLFLFGSRRPPDSPRVLALVQQELNRRRIRAFEEELDRVRRIVASYPAPTTVLVTVELPGTGGAAAEGFLYPWHRHLQWYLADYPVRLLVPEPGFALATRGHGPWRRWGRGVPVPAQAERLLFVLAGPLEGRLALPPARLLFEGRFFLLLESPLDPETRVGEFHFTPLP